jgi:transposase
MACTCAAAPREARGHGRGRNPERISDRFLFKKAGAVALDACRARAYKAGHDDMRSDRHSNYMPGALTKTSRRDKVLEPSRRPSYKTFTT